MSSGVPPGLSPIVLNRRKANCGWTLLEVLVVFSILTILLIIAWKGLFETVNRSKGVVNTGNHKQIAAALIAYASDHQGKLPWATEAENSKTRRIFTRVLTEEGYVTQPSIFFSPWAGDWWKSESERAALANPRKESVSPWYTTNYGANRSGAMPRKGVDSVVKTPANLRRVAADGASTRLMLLRDTFDISRRDKGGGIAWFTRNAHIPSAEDRGGYRYIHASFADGHVEVYSLEQYQEFLSDDEAPFYKDRFLQ